MCLSLIMTEFLRELLLFRNSFVDFKTLLSPLILLEVAKFTLSTFTDLLNAVYCMTYKECLCTFINETCRSISGSLVVDWGTIKKDDSRHLLV